MLDLPISLSDIALIVKRTMSILGVLLTLALIGGCATHDEADSNSVLRKRESDNQIHGEVGASYGRSTGH